MRAESVGIADRRAQEPALASEQRPPTIVHRLSLRAIALCTLFAIGVNAFFTRRVFLFWDDYKFLGEAKDEPFDLAYLRHDLFSHFSPFTRFEMKVVLRLMQTDRSAVYWYMVALGAFVIVSVAVLMVVLFGRTARAAIGIVVVGTSLSILPATNWVTAGLNLLPALGLSALCLATGVLYVKHQRPLWAALSAAAYLLAVLDYEVAILMPLYVGVWVLLFRRRVTSVPLVPLLRRTWILWGAFAVIGLGSVVNYKRSYYAPAPDVPLGQAAEALRISFFETFLPSFLGIHNPGNRPVFVIGIVASIGVLIALIWWSMSGDLLAWRGWAFAALGWFVPTVALVLNRAGIYGVGVAGYMLYYPFATLLFVVGVLEASLHGRSVPARLKARALKLPLVVRAVAIAVPLVLMATAYIASVEPSLAQQAVARPARDFVNNVETSAQQIGDRDDFTVLNADVPFALVSSGFAPYNRLSRVMAINGVAMSFDDVGRPLYAADQLGYLRAARFTPSAVVTAEGDGADGVMAVTGAVSRVESGATCFTAAEGVAVEITPRVPLAATGLTLRTMFTVDGETSVHISILNAEGTAWSDPVDPAPWAPGAQGTYTSISSPSVAKIVLGGFSAPVGVCVQSVAVGTVDIG